MNTTPNFIPKRRILSREELNCIVEATDYQSTTRKIYNNAKEETANAKEQARMQGYNIGYSEGIKSAIEDMLESVDAVKMSLLSAENDLTSIVLAAIDKMIGDMDTGELARRAVIRALRDYADAIWVSIHAAPEDHAALTENISAITTAARGTTIRSIEADPILKPGEIMVETPKGRVHVGIRQQMARLQSGLERG
jgi:flagellar biosynthesis/type III secretory pathway protein FliH